MKIIDLVLQNAFRLMRLKEDSSADMARKLGISGAHMTRILKGKTNYLSDETWTRIEPIITPYIRTDSQAAPDPSQPPEVAAVLHSDLPPAEKAEILSALFSHRPAEERVTLPAPPTLPHPPPAPKNSGENTTRHKVRWHEAVTCPRCEEFLVIPSDGDKIICPECGLKLRLGIAAPEEKKGEKK